MQGRAHDVGRKQYRIESEQSANITTATNIAGGRVVPYGIGCAAHSLDGSRHARTEPPGRPQLI